MNTFDMTPKTFLKPKTSLNVWCESIFCSFHLECLHRWHLGFEIRISVFLYYQTSALYTPQGVCFCLSFYLCNSGVLITLTLWLPLFPMINYIQQHRLVPQSNQCGHFCEAKFLKQAWLSNCIQFWNVLHKVVLRQLPLNLCRALGRRSLLKLN